LRIIQVQAVLPRIVVTGGVRGQADLAVQRATAGELSGRDMQVEIARPQAVEQEPPSVEGEVLLVVVATGAS